MKIKASDFVSHIEKANMGGLVNEMVLGEKFGFAVTDDARSVLAFSKREFPSDLGEIGVFDLTLLKNLIQYSANSIYNQDEELDVSVVENRLIFTKGDNAVKFLLSNVKTISSTVSNINETLEKLRSKENVTVVLNSVDIDRCIKAISIINPEEILLTVDGGKVTCLIGKATEHNTVLNLGNFTSELKFSVKLKPDLFTKILQVLPNDAEVKLELREGFPAIFDSKDYIFVVSPVKED